MAAASTNYSSASSFKMTNAAETYEYDELMGLLLSFSKAHMGGVVERRWSAAEVLSKMDELLRSLRGLSAVLADMDPQLEFRRKRSNGQRFSVNARAAIEGHIAVVNTWKGNFEMESSAQMFLNIQVYIAEYVATDVEKLQKRHTRVILGGSERGLSTNVRSFPSTPSPSASGSESNAGSYYSGSSGYASFGGAKKLTRRRRR